MANRKTKTPANEPQASDLIHQARKEAQDLLEELKAVKIDARGLGDEAAVSIENLRCYQVLRSADRKGLQEMLFLLGLSSLGRSFSHVRSSVENILAFLSKETEARRERALEEIVKTRRIVEHNRARLLGGQGDPLSGARPTRVMITLPSDAAQQKGQLIRDLAATGVDIFRINTAHDSLETYRAMAAVIRELDVNRPDTARRRIYVDLCGPKIRTGPIALAQQPVKVGSNKIERVVYLCGPKTKSLSQKKDPKSGVVTPGTLAVTEELLKACEVGERMRATGQFEKRAMLEVIGRQEDRVVCRIDTKLYLDEKSELKIKGGKEKSGIFNIAQEPRMIRLFKGDRLLLTAANEPGREAQIDSKGEDAAPAQISCTHAGALEAVQTGHRVFIDDGKIAAKVIEKTERGLLCEAIGARLNGTVLQAEKGINFPDTVLDIPALSDEDRKTLIGVSEFADLIGLSFAQEASDVISVATILDDLKKPDTGLVAKIETARGVANLPAILEALIGTGRPAGVMIARGDLAIEMGFENLAWLQEEILDICAAAHVPVIWATQVLENQMKSNLPSRAEVTDAAMGSRAECVMLNKGAFAVDTIRVLERILESFHELYHKNRQLLGRNTLFS